MVRTILSRSIRVVRLERSAYTEIAHDSNATRQALAVVLGVAVPTAIVTYLAGTAPFSSPAATSPTGSFPAGYPQRIVLISGLLSPLFAVAWWVIWSYCCYIAATKVFGGRGTFAQALRALGYASAPGVLEAFTFIPVTGGVVGLVGSVWTIVTNVVAVSEVFNVHGVKLLLTLVVGFILNLVGRFLSIVVLGPLLFRMFLP